LDQAASARRSTVRTVSHRALKLLMTYDWPGNVRELQNVVLAAASRASDHEVLHASNLRFGDGRDRSRPPDPVSVRSGEPRRIDELEAEEIRKALEHCQGNKSMAFRMLGYGSRMTLLAKMDKYGIPRNYGIPPRSPSTLP